MLSVLLRKIYLLNLKQYTSIGGQALIEGVMLRSPKSFVMAIRRSDGKIHIKIKEWTSLNLKYKFLKLPVIRGAYIVFETMINSMVSLNYSANIAMEEELRHKAILEGKTYEEVYQRESFDSESLNAKILLTMLGGIAFALFVFVIIPHYFTEGFNNQFDLGLGLTDTWFHLIDGMIKAFIFIFYIKFISILPDIRRLFQYHGAEHKVIAVFESNEELTVENAVKKTRLHPRCGTSFVFFLLFISIICFSALFTLFPVGQNLPGILKHIVAVVLKIILAIPIAGLAYELIKFMGSRLDNVFCKLLSKPGMSLQKLTTFEPTKSQLEVSIAAMKTVLLIEQNNHNYLFQGESVIDIKDIQELRDTNTKLEEFLE